MVTDYEALDFFRDDGLLVDPYPYFEAIRAHGPAWREPHHDVVMVTGYEEAMAIYSDAKTWSSCTAVTGPFPGFPVPLEGDDVSDLIARHRDELPMSDQLPTLDPPVHTDHRSLLLRLITPKRLSSNEEFMWRLADRQLDTFLPQGACEFIGDFASPFAMLVIADLLGVPEEDHKKFEDALLHGGGGHGTVGGVDGESMAQTPLEYLYQQFTDLRRRAPTLPAPGRPHRARHGDLPRRLGPRGHRRGPGGGQPLRRRTGDDRPPPQLRPHAHRRGP